MTEVLGYDSLPHMVRMGALARAAGTSKSRLLIGDPISPTGAREFLQAGLP